MNKANLQENANG